jgi:peptide/nickel transport system permease protein
MWKYALRRLLIALPVLFIISILDFTFINLAPGDPLQAILPPEAAVRADITQQLYHQAGLDESIPVRYVRWIVALAQGNLGTSFQTSQPTMSMIVSAIAPTLVLTVTALILALLIGVPLGVFSALNERSLLDEFVTLISYVFTAIPSFFLALIAVFLFAVQLHWFPANGMHQYDKMSDPLDLAKHLILPAVCLALLHVPGYARYARSSMLDVMRQDYIRTARAKGLHESAITWIHTLPNALSPIITILGLSLPGLIGGSVLIEQVFAWPGMGTQSISSALFRDYPVFMGVSLVYAFAVLISNLVADLCYALVDPRIRYD